ncbi:MAG: glycoside hydrolase [Sphingobacteriales bacterium]|nr:glycoside hydrolase [Sphingobacteriales bacterium]MBI3720762.1 glycoside hydrolase [Sphingobacteriales bacterium]
MKLTIARGVIILFILIPVTVISQREIKRPVISGYYAGSLTAIDSFSVNKLDYIIFSFCHLKDNQLHVGSNKDSLLIQKMAGYKINNPGLKIILSLGGWGGCRDCSPVFSTKTGRKEFAKSTRELLDYFNADGIDLDWEYPAVAGYPGHPYSLDDKENFTALIKMLRRKLGKKKEISFAAGGLSNCIDSSFEWKKVMQKADKVNLMSYDLVNGYSTQTGHHTPLYSNAVQKESTANAVDKMIAAGVPSNKIIIGAAIYARFFEVSDTLNNGLYRPAIFQRGVSYKNIYDSLDTAKGFIKYFDPVSKAPYAFNSNRKLFVTYDDSISVSEKMQYIKQKKLGGIMFWQIMDDRFENGLLDVMYQRRKENEEE